MAQARRSAPIRPSEPPGCPPRKDLDRPNHRIRGKTGRFRTIRSRKHPRVRPWKLFSSLHPTSTPRKKLRSPLTSLASPSPELAVSPGLRSDTTSRSHPDCRFATPPSPFALRGARRPSTLATPTVVERGHAYRHLHTFLDSGFQLALHVGGRGELLGRFRQVTQSGAVRTEGDLGCPCATRPSPHFSHRQAEDRGRGRKAGLEPSQRGQPRRGAENRRTTRGFIASGGRTGAGRTL